MVPIQALALFSGAELEVLVAGEPAVDIALLRRRTQYEGYTAESPVVASFWRVMETFTAGELAHYVRFVWGRSRLPPTGATWTHKHTVARADRGDGALPFGQTCFFKVQLPAYSSDERMRWGLLTAIYFGSSGILSG